MDGCRLPIRPGLVPVVRKADGLVDQRPQQAREQVDLDPLAAPARLPFAQRRQDPDHGVLAGEHVHQRHADLGRLAVRGPGDAHQAPQGLDHEVVAGELARRRRCRSR